MDVSLQVMLSAPTHDTGDAGKNARRYVDGDIINLYDATVFATKTGQDWIWNEPVSSPRTGFVHIDGAPDGFITIDELRELLQQSIDASVDPDNPDITNVRDWNLDLLGLTPSQRSELLSNKQVTVKWNAIKNKVLRKLDGTDLESVFI